MAVIVLAEDDADLLAVTARLLQRAGHTVITAPDGAAAWEAVQRARPDAVVTDIDMPVMSGVDLAREIRADPESRRLPVLFISGSLVPGDSRPVDAQATAPLRKPFLARELTDCVAKILQTGHSDGQEPTVCP